MSNSVLVKKLAVEIVQRVDVDISEIDEIYQAQTVWAGKQVDGYGFTETEAVDDLKRRIVAQWESWLRSDR